MRLPHGILSELGEITGISPNILSDYAATRIRPGSKRALILESACKEIGLDVSFRQWLVGTSDEIKAALTNNHIKSTTTPEKNNSVLRKLLSRFFLKTT
jgi:hypothetical protein